MRVIILILLATLTCLANQSKVIPVKFAMYGRIDDKQAIRFKGAVEDAQRLNKAAIEVTIYSGGGYITSMYNILSTMESNSNIKFTCRADTAYSAAFIIFVMCDERIIGTKSRLMWHHAAVSTPFNATSRYYYYVADYLYKETRTLSLLVAMRSKYTIDEIMHNIKYVNWFIKPDEALKMGITDKIK